MKLDLFWLNYVHYNLRSNLIVRDSRLQWLHNITVMYVVKQKIIENLQMRFLIVYFIAYLVSLTQASQTFCGTLLNRRTSIYSQIKLVNYMQLELKPYDERNNIASIC